MKTLILFLICSAALAQSPERELSQATFQVHIRPQLVSIQQDIQQILLTFPGYPADVFASLKETDELSRLAVEAQASCVKTLDRACLPQLKGILKALRELDRVWLNAEARTVFPPSASLAVLVGKNRWHSFITEARALLALLESEVLALEAQRPSERLSIWELRRRASQLEGLANLMVIDFIPGKLQEEFRSAWMNFFRPLHKQCVQLNNRAFLVKNQGHLNFYWNLLNMRLTKRLKRTPEGMSGPLAAIQNRWNQVLKVGFVP